MTPDELVAAFIAVMKEAEEAARRSVLDGTVSCQVCRALVLEQNSEGHDAHHRAQARPAL
jgi:hypothetical protein